MRKDSFTRLAFVIPQRNFATLLFRQTDKASLNMLPPIAYENLGRRWLFGQDSRINRILECEV